MRGGLQRTHGLRSLRGCVMAQTSIYKKPKKKRRPAHAGPRLHFRLPVLAVSIVEGRRSPEEIMRGDARLHLAIGENQPAAAFEEVVNQFDAFDAAAEPVGALDGEDVDLAGFHECPKPLEALTAPTGSGGGDGAGVVIDDVDGTRGFRIDAVEGIAEASLLVVLVVSGARAEAACKDVHEDPFRLRGWIGCRRRRLARTATGR